MVRRFYEPFDVKEKLWLSVNELHVCGMYPAINRHEAQRCFLYCLFFDFFAPSKSVVGLVQSECCASILRTAFCTWRGEKKKKQKRFQTRILCSSGRDGIPKMIHPTCVSDFTKCSKLKTYFRNLTTCFACGLPATGAQHVPFVAVGTDLTLYYMFFDPAALNTVPNGATVMFFFNKLFQFPSCSLSWVCFCAVREENGPG